MPTIKDAKCILVLGATSGIGRALALAFHSLDSKPTVIVAGRRQERLEELSRQGERIKISSIDVSSSEDTLTKFVRNTVAQNPDLDAVVFSSGIQHIFDFTKPESINLSKIQDEVTINYVSIVKLIIMFLPQLLKLSGDGRPSFIVPITSGLGIVPYPSVPDYSATKAALHSLALSLRAQLSKTNVQVIEIIPPLVESELHDHQGITPALEKVWMPLDEYIRQVMDGLVRGDPQIAVGTAGKRLNEYEDGKLEAVQQLFDRLSTVTTSK
ncbi:NAD-P-binding protein [Trametes gibbosa]|nr:NAD-P-binding protein [Trametes gibbosa]